MTEVQATQIIELLNSIREQLVFVCILLVLGWIFKSR